MPLHQLFLRLQHRIHPIQGNHVHRRLRIDGRQNRIELVGIVTIHQHVHRLPVLRAQRFEHFEAAKMRAPNHHAISALQSPLDNRTVAGVQPHIKLPVLAIEQKNPVVYHAGKGKKMAIQLAPACAALPKLLVIQLQGRTRFGRKQQKIQRNATQQHTADAAPQQQRKPHHETHHGALAALLALRPFGLCSVRGLTQHFFHHAFTAPHH